MKAEVVGLVLVVGVATYALRFLPARLGAGPKSEAEPGSGQAGGAWSRFLAATGPAAIAALCVASAMPLMAGDLAPLIAGTAAVLVVFRASRSVVGATLAGAGVYGAVVGWLAG